MDDTIPSRMHTWLERLRRLRSGLKKIIPFSIGVAATLVALLLYSFINPPPPQLTTKDVNSAVASAMASATPPPPYAVGVYQVIQPSLVLIQTQSKSENGKDTSGLGSGVIIDANGDILTCFHVIDGATDIQLTFADGTQSSAQVLNSQPENDIAVLQAAQLPSMVVPAVLGNPNAMQIGDEAYAVGNPFGLYGSMSAGIISGFNRSFQPSNSTQALKGLIQFDTAVNPGNSGGPLLNRAGQVIGIVEGIVNPTGQDVFVGIGFAVPINTAGGAAGLPPY